MPVGVLLHNDPGQALHPLGFCFLICKSKGLGAFQFTSSFVGYKSAPPMSETLNLFFFVVSYWVQIQEGQSSSNHSRQEGRNLFIRFLMVKPLPCLSLHHWDKTGVQ